MTIAADGERLLALVEAAWQVLDDMGTTGQTCSAAAKAQLRVAFEPFRTQDDEFEVEMPLEDAQAILEQAELLLPR